MADVGDYWLNVDIPTRSCTLHSMGCTYETKKAETPHKGLGRLKEHGGWLSFEGPKAAEAYCRAQYPKMDFKKCGRCC